MLDTNVFVRNFKARANTNANRRVVRLWLLERRLQLIVSPEVVAEYLEIFDRILGMGAEMVKAWRLRFEEDRCTTLVRPARHYIESRDPDET